ncbi:hypothetical protein IFM89_030136 [Coptis chinensis]|uniref:Uncharacterized protein n=1 Tax=Coptis chinensis TaxID=261450 RepID=A0A835M018_9MAGN|nr:hypothetical protein IFM89_030136 [Coptis chinensis]
MFASLCIDLLSSNRYVDAVMTIPKGTLFPMCGMKLGFNRELIGPAMYFGVAGVLSAQPQAAAQPTTPPLKKEVASPKSPIWEEISAQPQIAAQPTTPPIKKEVVSPKTK